jgi:benzoyl-CoA reductase/2-hydroxyglutaryl-CoA dehydratase subunit BcrC/BadD/HgdB
MIGITTTVPLEIPLAAGLQVVDLNNVFVTHKTPLTMVEDAETAGFPRNTCSWIKGIYSAIREKGIRRVIAVTEGDCSNTKALMEVLESEGIETIPFAYPLSRKAPVLEAQLRQLAETLGTTLEAAEKVKIRLDKLRTKLAEIDRLTWEENRVNGVENHLFLVNASDMKGDVAAFEQEIDAFLNEAHNRAPDEKEIRLAFIGVPPIFTDIYESIENLGARVVFNEIQRQFAMLSLAPTLVEQYRIYTYPYSIALRLEDIRREIARRRIDGVLHYVQSFCFRQIEDMVVRKNIDLPILTLEGDQPGALDARSRIRLESFIAMLRARRKKI